MANRGLMAENMFLGQSQLLQWLNNTLSLRLEKIEETCSGAVACQLMDCLFPGSVNMKRVDFNVRNDWEYVNNYKELQRAFTKMKVDKAFNVNQLSKGKRQDSIEFMQWFKGYWDSVTNGEDVASEYSAVERRQNCKTGDWKKYSTSSAPKGRIAAVTKKVAQSPAVVSSRGNAKSTIKAARVEKEIVHVVDPELESKVQSLMEEVTELRLKVDTAERERDFYFDKLRDIEILCQAPELADVPVLRIVEQVLYATDSEEAKKIMLEAETKLGAQLVPQEIMDQVLSPEAQAISPR
ncbi:Microtubule-associated protein RP/EB family member 1B [Picochlorum sp. SENEW3]|nr:Microtubule-associated protein RP/EB family member 1B [Picochlorum sp. SENEW3]